MKKEIFFDGNIINSKDEFHLEFAKTLSFPSYYSHNLDDLWTSLTSYIDPNIRLMIRGLDHLSLIFGAESQGLLDVFEKLPEACPELELIIQP